MLFYNSLSKKPRIFRKLTGLSLSEFDGLVEKLQPEMKKRFSHRGRRRKLLLIEDKLCVLLIYTKSHIKPYVVAVSLMHHLVHCAPCA